jgi:hypothetical protein
VPDLKGPHALCPHQGDGCGIYESPDRPPVCATFQCAWLRGIGTEEDRPDKSKAMFSLNRTKRGVIGMCVELEEDALTGPARDMAVSFAQAWKGPVVVEEYGGAHPADRLLIHKDLELRAMMMLGTHIADLGAGVNLFTLRR